MFETFITIFILLELYLLFNPNRGLQFQQFSIQLEELKESGASEQQIQNKVLEIMSETWGLLLLSVLYLISTIIWLFILPFPVKLFPIAMLVISYIIKKFGEAFRRGDLSLQNYHIVRTIDGFVSIGILVGMLWFG